MKQRDADRLPEGPGNDQQDALQILVVEDSPDHAELVARAFQSAPFPSIVTNCKSVAEARLALEAFTPDLIVADMLLPDGRGTDLLDDGERVRPLVLMTSYGDENQAVQAIKAGSLDYVVKSELAFSQLPEISRRAVRAWRSIVGKEAAQEALARSEDNYRTLFENVPAGVFQCDRDGQFVTVNPAMVSMLGYKESGQLEDLNLIRDVIVGGRDAPATAADLDRSSVAPEMEVEMQKAEGGTAVVLMTTQTCRGGDKTCCYEGFCFDITRRRKADQALAESRLRFEATFRDSAGFMAIVDVGGRVADINAAVLRAVGCVMDDVIDKPLWEMPWWQDLDGEPEAVRFGLERAFAGKHYHDQTAFRAVDGSTRVADRSFTPVLDKQGQLKFVVVEGRDVTELMETSKRLQQSENQFRTLFENAPEAVVVLDVESVVFTDVNSNAEALFEASRDELIGMNLANLNPRIQPGRGLSVQLAEQYLQAAVAGQKPVFEWTHQTMTGREVPCEVRLTRLPHDNRLLVRGSITDISLRKQSDGQLRQSEQRLGALVESATAGILEIDPQGRILSANPAAVGMLGHNSVAELEGRAYLDYVVDADRKRVSRQLKDVWSGHNASLVYGIAGFKNEHVISSSLVAIRGADGALSRVMLMSDDITERHRNEARFLAEQKFTETVINSLPGIFYVLNEQRELVRWNENFQKISGYSSEEFEKIHPLMLFAEEDRPRLKFEMEQVLNGKEGRLEARILTSEGRHIPFMLTGLRLQTETDNYMVGMGFDISERKEFEAQLRASENYLRSIVESEPECVWTLDRRGRLLDINPAGRFMLGEETVAYAKRESITALVSPDHRRAFAELNDSVFAGQSGILTFNISARRGEQRWLETHAVALRDEHGEIEVHLAVTRDVTAKRVADRKIGEYSRRLQKLSQRLLDAQELERRHVARELHDEVGQSLTALKLDLEAIGNIAGAGGERLLDSLRIVERILEQVRGMSLDLRPAILDDLGLMPALRWYVDRQAARSGIGTSLLADALTGVRLSAEIETAAFRIVQEALTNVARHSGASRAQVLLEIEAQRLWIHIRDNGAGFDSVDALRSSTQGESFGLLGLQERAILLGGQVEINSQPGKGAEVVAWLPIADFDRDVTEAEVNDQADAEGLKRQQADRAS